MNYKSPRIKEIEISIRRGLCQDASQLNGSDITLDALDRSGSVVDI